MKRHGLESAADLAKFSEVGWSTANQWMKGSIPRKLALSDLAGRFKVAVSWLESGYGPKEPANLKAAHAMQSRIYEAENHANVVQEEYSPPKRDETLALARARTERYSNAAGEALEETLTDLRDLLEILAGSGPQLSPAMLAAAKERIDHFAQELARQREADTQGQLTD